MQQHRTSATTLFLVRHAEANDRDANGRLMLVGQVDMPLSPRGQLQADHLRVASARLQPVRALYTSGLRRAIDTAWPLASELGLEPRSCTSLNEISCGDLDGEPIEHIKRAQPMLWQANMAQADDDFGWPGGETYRGFRARVLGAIRALAGAHAGERIVLVTHAGVVGQILGYIDGQPAARWEPWRPSHASITEVRWHGEGGSLVRFDDRHHLREAREHLPADQEVLNVPLARPTAR